MTTVCLFDDSITFSDIHQLFRGSSKGAFASRRAVILPENSLEYRHCGCKHFRVIYTRRGWGGKLIRRLEW